MKEEPIVGIPKLGPVIAIDGPAGTGKSSATRKLAHVLGFVHVDTGALYRAVAFLFLEKRSQLKAGDDSLAISIARTVHLEFRWAKEKTPSNRIFADGRDLTDFIRTPEISMEASRISAIPEVRAALLGLQRKLGCAGRTILEGRDIGTVVFPDADVKFFLTATADERAKRRLKELQAAGGQIPSFENVKSQIIARDEGDSNRSVAPLKRAEDALEVDTTSFNLEEVVQQLETTVRNRLKMA